MRRKYAEWWVGQAIALYLGIAAIGAYNFVAGSIVTYSLFLLIDIRAELRKLAEQKEAANG